MNILIVSGTFPPREFGGVTESSYRLATSLRNKGYTVSIFTTDVGNDKKNRLKVPISLSLDGMEIRYFRNLSNYFAFNFRLYLPLGSFFYFLRKIRKFDIIAIQDFRSLFSILVYFLAKKFRIPYIIQARGSLPYNIGNYRFKWLYDKLFGLKILSSAYKVFALSETESKQYQNFGVEKSKVKIIPNWIDIENYINLPKKGNFRKEYGISSEKIIILFLGRINKIKGLDLLIKSCSILFKELKDALLVVVGPDDGDLHRNLQLVKQYKIESKVKFVGPIYGRKKASVYFDSDVYVLPSFYEVFGNTIIESLACETPVITTTRCQISDLVEEAGVVTAYNARDISNAMLKLLNSPNLREKLGKIGRDIVFKRFTPNAVINNVIDVFKSLKSSNV